MAKNKNKNKNGLVIKKKALSHIIYNWACYLVSLKNKK